MNSSTLLIADIGGTKSDIALFDQADVHTPLYQQRFINAQHLGIHEILTQFKATVGMLPAVACFAVAGLVRDNTVEMTNLPWQFSGNELMEQLGFDEVLLINDLTAVASSIRYLDSRNEDEVKTLYHGEPDGGSVIGVVAPGTGLGEGFVVQSSSHSFVTGTEGGHADFAPVNEDQRALLAWAQQQYSPVSYETVIGGAGFCRLYDFCKTYYAIKESHTVKQAMAASADRTPAIIQAAIAEHPCPLCQKVVELFLNILGSEAGNLALKVYAKGGIFLAGGILPRIVDHVSFDGFRENFLRKGAMTSLMKDIPVRLILHKNAALIGAAGYLVEFLSPKGKNQ